jgi:sporulation protein YlmC with PRC-barrel domain
MRENSFPVGYRLLDDQLVDSDGRRCGRVDDLEIDGEPGSPAEIAAILSGPGVFSARMPRLLQGMAKRLFGDEVVRVPWDAVEDIDETVHLKRPAAELGLARGDDAAARIIGRIPGSER